MSGDATGTTFETIGDRLPANFVEQIAEEAGGYKTKKQLDWSEQADTPAAEIQALIDEWSSKHATKLDQFTSQLTQLLDDVAQEPADVKAYVDEEL